MDGRRQMGQIVFVRVTRTFCSFVPEDLLGESGEAYGL